MIQGINVHSAHNNQTRSKYTLSVPYDGNNIRHYFCVKCNNTKLGIAIIQTKKVHSSHNNKKPHRYLLADITTKCTLGTTIIKTRIYIYIYAITQLMYTVS